jgi:protease I
MSKRILIATGDCAEALEVYYPLFRIREQGWHADVAAPSRKRLQLVVHDFEDGCETYTEKPGYGLAADLAFSDVNVDDYDGLVLPGGRAPEYIRNAPGFAEILKAFVAQNKPIAATCHAFLCMAPSGIAKGRTMTAYPQLACDVRGSGATFKDAEVVVDGNLITARAWPDNPAWMREFINAVEKKKDRGLRESGLRGPGRR